MGCRTNERAWLNSSTPMGIPNSGISLFLYEEMKGLIPVNVSNCLLLSVSPSKYFSGVCFQEAAFGVNVNCPVVDLLGKLNVAVFNVGSSILVVANDFKNKFFMWMEGEQHYKVESMHWSLLSDIWSSATGPTPHGRSLTALPMTWQHPCHNIARLGHFFLQNCDIKDGECLQQWCRHPKSSIKILLQELRVLDTKVVQVLLARWKQLQLQLWVLICKGTTFHSFNLGSSVALQQASILWSLKMSEWQSTGFDSVETLYQVCSGQVEPHSREELCQQTWCSCAEARHELWQWILLWTYVGFAGGLANYVLHSEYFYQ